MAFKFPDKHPDERLDYTVDWSRYLATGESIHSGGSQWKIQKADGSYVLFNSDKSFEGDAVVENTASTVGLTMISETYTATKAIIVLSKGVANTSYRLLCEIQVNDADGVVTNREINLRVRERSECHMITWVSVTMSPLV